MRKKQHTLSCMRENENTLKSDTLYHGYVRSEPVPANLLLQICEASREPPGSLPGASREPLGGLPGASLEAPGSLPGASREPPGSPPGASREPPGSLPGTSRELPGRLPRASRELPGSIPGACLPGASGELPGSLPGASWEPPGSLREPRASREPPGSLPGACREPPGSFPRASRKARTPRDRGRPPLRINLHDTGTLPGASRELPASLSGGSREPPGSIPGASRELLGRLPLMWRQTLKMPNFSPLFGRTLCPAVLGGARRPVAKAVVKNPFVADSSSEESFCGDKEILRCQIFLRYLVVPGARRHWAVPRGLLRHQ